VGATSKRRIAIVYAGDREARQAAGPEKSRFLKLFQAFSEIGAHAECAVYHDDFCDEVRQQLLGMDAALVWVNPIEGDTDRAMLDAMLRDVAAAGTFVSTHPDTILKMGTKDVLVQTRSMGWGSDTCAYQSIDELTRGLASHLSAAKIRVLKQHRGNGGNGVWKVERARPDRSQQGMGTSSDEMIVRVRHAKRGSVDEIMRLGEFVERCSAYFERNGMIIDQEYLPRLPEGMIRCYLVHDKVGGFGHQAINALCPPPPGAPPEASPQLTPRIYHPASLPEFQPLKQRLEREWVREMQQVLDIRNEQLPILWDCDFLLGPKTASGEDSYVLCEINVSCVSPFPDSAVPLIAKATLASLR
jgi:glutathione synthase/RimK-type ligase-like ATP-grasp enzyme